LNETTQIRSDLAQLSEELSRMKDRAYRSPDEAYAELIAVQTRLNYALRKLAAEPTSYQLLVTDLPKTMEGLIGAFIERARAVAKLFSAAQFSVQVSGFPPNVSLSLTWAR
jgi:hypothetical protein